MRRTGPGHELLRGANVHLGPFCGLCLLDIYIRIISLSLQLSGDVSIFFFTLVFRWHEFMADFASDFLTAKNMVCQFHPADDRKLVLLWEFMRGRSVVFASSTLVFLMQNCCAKGTTEKYLEKSRRGVKMNINNYVCRMPSVCGDGRHINTNPAI